MSNLNDLTIKIKEKKPFVWDKEDVVELIRNHSNQSLDPYPIKHEEAFWKLAMLLNEGYLHCRVIEYEAPLFERTETLEMFFDGFKTFKLGMDAEKSTAFDKIAENTTYYSEVIPNYRAWEEFFYKKGSKDVEFKKRNYLMYAKDIQSMFYRGDISISHLLKSFLKDELNKFYIAPYNYENQPQQSIQTVYVLERTKTLGDYIEQKKKEDAEDKAFYKKVKQKKKPYELPKFNRFFILDKYDLVEFKYEGKIKRGFVVEKLPSGKQGIQIANEKISLKEAYIQERSHEPRAQLRDMLGIERRKVNTFIDETGYEEVRILIETSKNGAKGLESEFYAIEKKDILTKIPLNATLIASKINEVFERRKDPTLKIDIETEDGPSNAAYVTYEHKILVNLRNIFNYCIDRFIKQGLRIEDTIEILMAHELGHSDQRAAYLFDDHYRETISRFNKVNQQIRTNLSGIIQYTVEPHILEETIALIKEHLSLIQAFQEIELTGEKDAYQYGLDYVSNELKLIFQKNNYELFCSYKEQHERLYLQRKNDLYFIQKIQPTYEKRNEVEGIGFGFEDFFN